jgi:hypothetical protein
VLILRRKAFLLALSLLLLALDLPAHDIITTNLTFTRDISRIFAQRCVSCHGATSSIPLTTYEEARPWAVSIKEQVLSRAMPPWGAVKGFGNLTPDHALSQEEIMIISAWVIGGAPKGDPKLLPKPGGSPIPVDTPPALKDAVVIQTRAELNMRVHAAGLRPLPDRLVNSARLIARLPDGRIEPLVWLYRYDPKLDPVFTFSQPLDLPIGTVVESSTPLRFALETVAPSSVARR